MATKQRARRRRAAYTLAFNNTLETDPINRDSDGDMLWDGDKVYPGNPSGFAIIDYEK